MWQSNMQEMFGDSLELGEDHANWWLYIPHIINTPFYVYAYAFGCWSSPSTPSTNGKASHSWTGTFACSLPGVPARLPSWLRKWGSTSAIALSGRGDAI